jgi:hypothetical protein
VALTAARTSRLGRDEPLALAVAADTAAADARHAAVIAGRQGRQRLQSEVTEHEHKPTVCASISTMTAIRHPVTRTGEGR